MKRLFRAFLMSLAMFTVIPVPARVWDEDARPLMTLFLPVVGLIVGGLWTLLAYLARLLELPNLVAGIALCAFPFLITGGIHMDGYLDVTDAVRSYRDLDQRRKILKDPNVGSFAVLAGNLLILTQFALLASAGEDAELWALLIIPTVSRTAASLAVTVLRPMAVSEYAGAYRRGVKKAHAVTLGVLLALELAAGFVFRGKAGFPALAVLLGYCHHAWRAYRSLDGFSGDVSGYALTFAEVCGIAVYALL